MTAIVFPDRAAWLAERQKNIGGSEIAALFGVQAAYQQSYYALWQIKSGRIPAPDLTGERPAWGLRLESVIAEALAETHGWQIAPGGYVRHPSIAGLACTLDFVIMEGHPRCEADGPGILEIKNVDALMHKRQWVDEPPLHIQLQAQHQLACTDMKWGCIGYLIGGNELGDPIMLERRPKIIAEIERRVADFWRGIEEKREPVPDGSETTAAALAAMFPESHPGEAIDLTADNEFPFKWSAYKAARANRLDAEKQEAEAKNWIMAKMGTAELLRYNGEIIATAKMQTRKAYSVKESSSRVLRIKEK